MPVKIGDIVEFMEEWAPRSYAVWPGDNPGLQVGDPSAQVQTVLVAVDAIPAVIEEAVRIGAGLVVTHHPLLFKAVNSIDVRTGAGKLLAGIISSGISVFSAHTNLDVAPGGVDDTLARIVGLGSPGRPGRPGGGGLQVLDPSGEDSLVKLVVFVPRGFEDNVRDAMTDAGAGWIGNYSHCTFQAPGTGTFKPLDGANPFLGEVGRVEKAEELRVETIMPESIKGRVLKAMLEAHPYEEVAFDLYPLRNPGRPRGTGRVGDLPEPMALGELASKVAQALGARYVRVFGDPTRKVARVATAAGGGGDSLFAAARAGADVLVTGDIRHSHAVSAAALGLALVDAGHFSTERPVVFEIVRRLNERFRPVDQHFEARPSQVEGEPFTVVAGETRGGARASGPPPAVGAHTVGVATGCPGAVGGAGRTVTAYVDGGSRGNPGPAAWAVILVDEGGGTIVEEGGLLPEMTNNQAEYHGVIEAARRARDAGATRLVINTDSELVARQISGAYEVKNAGLAKLHSRAVSALRQFERWEVRAIPREENRRADRLVNATLDSAEGRR